MLDVQRIQIYDPVGSVMRAELPRLGFDVVTTDADAVFTVRIQYSDFSPVSLDLTLNSAATGRTLWSAQVTRNWDIHASVVEASERNATFAMGLLERDLARAQTHATVAEKPVD